MLIRMISLSSRSTVSNYTHLGESMTAADFIQIALDSKLLDPVEEGYTLEDGNKNTFAPDTVIDLDKNNVFYATENTPGPASYTPMNLTQGTRSWSR